MASSAHDMQKHIKLYVAIFVALLVLTAVTVLVAELDVTIGIGIVIAMIVACVKGGLVSCFFMHLTTEKGILFWILGITVLFFFVLLLLPMITSFDNPMIQFVDPVSGNKIGS